MDANTGGSAQEGSLREAIAAGLSWIPARRRALPPADIHQCRDAFQRERASDVCCWRLQKGGFVIRNVVLRKMMLSCVVMVPVVVAGCATPQAADINGRWRPVNRFAEAPQAIPLQQAYIYQASPADGTLKTMLGRWAKDARLTLAYLHPNDYTLHAPIANIRTGSLEDAAAALSAAYAEQGVQVSVERPRIIVSQALPPSADVAPTAPLGD